ncbi:uncharacterized protein LOC121005826 [Bufo bufo]|uniref:uncharacterized protein LOC121005826 n=1 Tax=Bufo bufo TaxID=8384 RepID=UPI001ABE6371|nr:uncharacterized protein LOC121005826 [Bufo bufo]XP_040294532.1 uncharacterized protein LOC121005826 [Bufo bufo]
MRDRFKKNFNEEVKRPSGSGGTHKQPYRYVAALGFLRRTLELRRTSSSTRAPEAPCEVPQEAVAQEAVPEKPPTAGPSRPAQAAGQDLNVPLPVPSGNATMATLAPLFEALMRRQRTGRSRQVDYEDFTRLVYESLMGFTNRVATLEDNVRHLQEGAVLTSQMGPVHYYWLSLLPVMERFTPDQLFEARRQVDSILWQVQHRPTSLPPSMPYPHPKLPFPHPKLPIPFPNLHIPLPKLAIPHLNLLIPHSNLLIPHPILPQHPGTLKGPPSDSSHSIVSFTSVHALHNVLPQHPGTP